jgi:hypothetical protein
MNNRSDNVDWERDTNKCSDFCNPVKCDGSLRNKKCAQHHDEEKPLVRHQQKDRSVMSFLKL